MKWKFVTRKILLLLKKKSRKLKMRGFTLIECLLSLFVLSIICLLLSSVLTNTQIVVEKLKNTSDKEWQIFLIQLENELKNCEYIATDKNRFIFINKKNGKNVWIEFKLGKIVKVENGGYQPLLTQINNAVFSEQKEYIELNITFENDLQMIAKWAIKRGENSENKL